MDLCHALSHLQACWAVWVATCPEQKGCQLLNVELQSICVMLQVDADGGGARQGRKGLVNQGPHVLSSARALFIGPCYVHAPEKLPADRHRAAERLYQASSKNTFWLNKAFNCLLNLSSPVKLRIVSSVRKWCRQVVGRLKISEQQSYLLLWVCLSAARHSQLINRKTTVTILNFMNAGNNLINLPSCSY